MARHSEGHKSYTSIRVTKDTHAGLVRVKGEIESATGKQASVNTVISKLVKEHKKA